MADADESDESDESDAETRPVVKRRALGLLLAKPMSPGLGRQGGGSNQTPQTHGNEHQSPESNIPTSNW